MARKGENRTTIDLACSECREKNYSTSKNTKNDPQKLERRKYCPRCRTHTLHKEGK